MPDGRPDDTPAESAPATRSAAYAGRLQTLGGKRWKRWLDVQAPYRWNLRRLRPGFVLDLGCGLGRNLAHLDGNGVGIDHNESCVAATRASGFTAYTPDEFATSPDARTERFDSLLLAHVLEHLPADGAAELVSTYLPYVKQAGRIIVITPQEAGQRSDPTHVRFVDFDAIGRMLAGLGWRANRQRSYPFPRAVGRAFPYNEFVVVAERDRQA